MLQMCCSFDAPEGLRQGSDSVTQDFLTNIYRMKQLGFNAVRLPYRFSDFLYLNPLIVEHQCQVAPAVRGLPCSSYARNVLASLICSTCQAG